MVNLLIALLFAGIIKKKRFNFKKLQRTFKKDSKYTIALGKDIFSEFKKVFKFASRMSKSFTNKKVCQATVIPIKNEKVIDFEQYRLKKAK